MTAAAYPSAVASIRSRLANNCGTGAGGFQPGNRCSGGGGVSPEKIKEVSDSPKADALLADIFKSNRNTAMFGGCRVVAEAILKLHPEGELVALVDSRYTPEHIATVKDPGLRKQLQEAVDSGDVMVDHYAVKVGEDRYLDGQGERTEQQMKEWFEDHGLSRMRFSAIVPATPDMVRLNKQILSPPGAADRFAELLKGAK